MSSKLQVASEDVWVYDPLFQPVDLALLVRRGYQLIPKNEVSFIRIPNITTNPAQHCYAVIVREAQARPEVPYIGIYAALSWEALRRFLA